MSADDDICAAATGTGWAALAGAGAGRNKLIDSSPQLGKAGYRGARLARAGAGGGSAAAAAHFLKTTVCKSLPSVERGPLCAL